MTHPDRLRAVRRLALGSGDLNLAAECEAELRRQGESPEGETLVALAQEIAVPPKARKSKVTRGVS